uniref:Uncharacterized protein n=1 Tax=Arundo donax TaxID=35708 RepID=A0A0A9GC90_ARUDO
MLKIFGNSVATGKYAKGSNEPLATEVEDSDKGQEEIENGATGTDEVNGASSSATRPSKRAKIVESDEEGLIGAFKAGTERIAVAIEKAAKGDNELPPDLFHNVVSLPGFNDTHKSFYYAHLVEKPHMARAFNGLPFDYKLSWLAKFVSETFPGC